MKTLVVFAFMAVIATPLVAQDTEPKITEETRWILTAVQMQNSLEEAHSVSLTQTLKNSIVLSTLYRDKVDLTRSIPTLQKIHANATNPVDRRLALSALQAIGTYRALDYVERHTTEEEFKQGRMLIASVVNDFYLAHTDRSAS